MQEGETMSEDNPADIHFAYAGYAPLSVRIVQQASSPGVQYIQPVLPAGRATESVPVMAFRGFLVRQTFGMGWR